MSVKKEPSGRRWIQVEVEVPGTPEEVWRAIATGPGISSWFVPTKMEERKGGEIVCTFGPGMDSAATVTEWDAPRRFAAESDLGAPGSPKMASEWTVEARSGGTCLVRVVNSLFASTDDWDGQLSGLEEGWPAYFRVLRLYLERYKGLPGGCSTMQFVGFSSDPEPEAWRKAGRALGLFGLDAGQAWRAPAGLPPMSGTVDTLGKGSHKHTVLVRLDSPSPGTAYAGAFGCGGTVMVCLSVYLYGEGAKAAVEREEPKWQAWMGEAFPMPAMG